MMKSLVLAAWILSALLSFSSCQERQYYFVNQLMNWDDAQRYCRAHHTDLATIGNSTDVKQFLDIVSSTDKNVWIGLYSNINWTWSGEPNSVGSQYRNWESSDYDPDFILANQFCVCIGDNGGWWDYDCAKKFPFVCYNARTNEFVAVDEAMSWSNARTYCQQNFTDLATIRNITENQRVQTLVPTGYWAWTGLHRDENIYWSDQSSFGFRNWDHKSNLFGSDTRICGATSEARSAKWKFLPCQTQLPFVCYSFKVMRRIVKIKLSSTVNLTDPVHKAQLLKQLQEKLNESASLKFVEQPKKDKKRTEL
ncbi:C-type mannose receptor 2-like [Poecilia reticulata]|uniref:C-type mannose receptor 2-like n=1 Tax=Poecilia reticulata TaxID=8081 RepID=UPI0004A393E4|nr:PREDICTED: C-type mannose receptor 2-like [Poecilia reticulata]